MKDKIIIKKKFLFLKKIKYFESENVITDKFIIIALLNIEVYEKNISKKTKIIKGKEIFFNLLISV